MATMLGADTALDENAPVTATTSLVRGRHGVRISLTLSPRSLAKSASIGQPQGVNMRSTRSRQMALEPPSAKLEWSSDDERSFCLAMRRHGADLQAIQRRVMPSKSRPEVVEFYYSARGQAIEARLEEEKAAAERVRENIGKRSAASTAERERYDAADAAASCTGELKIKGKKASRERQVVDDKLALKRSRVPLWDASDTTGKEVASRAHLPPVARVSVHLSARGMLGVRLRLQVRVKPGARRSAPAADRKPIGVDTAERDAAGSSPRSRANRAMPASGMVEKPVAAQLQVTADGTVQLSLTGSGTGA